MTTDAMDLPDGRRLCWHEFGDEAGSPVFYTSGTPVSGLAGASYDEPARAAGLRWISPDKPGYGGSDYQSERSLTSWGDDLAALAGQLGLDRFALAGESGGGPYTLAAAANRAFRWANDNAGPLTSQIRPAPTTSPARRCHGYGIADALLSFALVDRTASPGQRCRNHSPTPVQRGPGERAGQLAGLGCQPRAGPRVSAMSVRIWR
jgi:pimeloyl-ACP methyl ester carboxylesterase